jgi:hypothetical protein
MDNASSTNFSIFLDRRIFSLSQKNDLSSQGVQPAWPQMNQGGGEKWGCTDEFPVPA